MTLIVFKPFKKKINGGVQYHNAKKAKIDQIL